MKSSCRSTGIADSAIGVLPAGILAVLQFFPIIRHKVIMFHRINGWLVTLLLLAANAGALMIADRAFGGHFDTQVLTGVLVIFTTVSAAMGIINIKRKQIDQHRKWMIRCWVYAASIISLRFVQMAAVEVVSRLRGFYVNMPCEAIAGMGGNSTLYPNCAQWGDDAFTTGRPISIPKWE